MGSMMYGRVDSRNENLEWGKCRRELKRISGENIDIRRGGPQKKRR